MSDAIHQLLPTNQDLSGQSLDPRNTLRILCDNLLRVDPRTEGLVASADRRQRENRFEELSKIEIRWGENSQS